MDAFVVERGLSEVLARAKVALLRAAVAPARALADGALFCVELEDTRGNAELVQHLGAFLDCHRIVMEEARKQGIEIAPYKALDQADIVAALACATRADGRGTILEQAALLWHELVWAQGLPNANHRTALLFLERWFNPPAQPLRFDPASAPEWAERLIRGSKPLILDKEFAPDLAAAKAAHRDWSIAAFRRFPVSRAGGR